MMKINDTVLKDGKEVKIVAITEQGDFVCRYIDDIEGKHVNRCYLYKGWQLQKREQKLLQVYDLTVLRGNIEVATVPYSRYPSNDEIIAQLLNYNGTDATVKKRHKLVY